MRKLSVAFAATLPVLAMTGLDAGAQSWPAKPIRLVTVEIGGGLDIAARTLSQALSPGLGQRLVVENRASITRPEQQILKSAPDGYTLLYWANPLWLSPFMSDVNYDPIKDFAPISLVAQIPGVLIVHPSLPVKSVKELVALAKAKPKQLNVGSTSNATSSNTLAALLFIKLTGTDIVRINYKGTGQSISAVAAGEVHMAFPTLAGSLSYIQSGRLRALAVTTRESSPALPNVPPLRRTYPEYESASAHALVAVANTPQPIIARLYEEVAKVIRDPAVREQMTSQGMDPLGGSGEQLHALMRSEMRNTGKLIKDMGLKAN